MTIRPKTELISVREAAKECGRNMETVRRWIWAGKLPAEKLGNQLFIKRGDFTSFCRETATVKYNAKSRLEGIAQLEPLKERIRARTGRDFNEDEIGGAVEKQREERMEQIEQSIRDTATMEQDRKAKLNFLKKATAIRNKIHARTGEVFSAEAMIRELREEREHELE